MKRQIVDCVHVSESFVQMFDLNDMLHCRIPHFTVMLPLVVPRLTVQAPSPQIYLPFSER